MAVRLHMNLGLVAESQRLPDSADTVVVVEPVIGSTIRTKGSLFLLVTGAGGRRLRDATRIVAERIRDDYYYDLSAGISVCLRKAVRAANNVLLHTTDRPLVGPDDEASIGVALAVVRGNELYVATLGPAEAYLVRQARLLTLPDANPDSGLPSATLEGPEVWHGEITAGDCLILLSPNVTGRIGLGPIQDAVLQLHPQAAVEQIHSQFGSGSLGSTGGDGILFVEATEVASTHKASPLKPVWPGESLAGAPQRSPIPLADSVVEGVAAVQTSARHAQVAADGWLRRGVNGLFDRMPRRPMSRGRVMPMTVRRERQQRAAVGIVGLLAVTAIVGTSMYLLSGAARSDTVDKQRMAQQAYAKSVQDMDTVYGHGRDLMKDDPETAFKYLKDAYDQMAIAEQNGYSPAVLANSRAKAVAGLNEYYHVTMVAPQTVVSFATDDLEGLILGPDGGGYVLDSTVGTVYRVNLQTGARVPVMVQGQAPADGNGVVGPPRLLTTGGGDVLMLDAFNSLWRWHPAAGDTTGRGALLRVIIPDNANWGVGARAIATFLTNEAKNIYNFYIVVPSRQQIVKYTPANDGSSFPKDGQANYLAVGQDVSTIDDMYIDAYVYIVDKGKITEYERGQAVGGWKPDPPPDTLLRPKGTYYTRLAADDRAKGQGTFYAFDNLYRRVVAFAKADGTIAGQYTVAPGAPWLTALTGLFVVPGTNGAPATLYWTEAGSLMKATLAATTAVTPSTSGSASPSASTSS